MNWIQANRGTAIIVAVTCAVPLLLFFYLLIGLWMQRDAYQDEIDNLEPRIARFMGVMQAEEDLLMSAASLETRVLNLVYPPTEDNATVSAALQKDVRGIMSASGLVVTDSRILPAQREGIFDVIGLMVSVNGGIDALDGALSDVAAYTPLLLVRSINITPQRATRGKGADAEQVVTARIGLLALRSAE